MDSRTFTVNEKERHIQKILAKQGIPNSFKCVRCGLYEGGIPNLDQEKCDHLFEVIITKQY